MRLEVLPDGHDVARDRAQISHQLDHLFEGVSYGVVYANGPARAPFERPEPTTFPVGSVIVREKLTNPGDETPDLLAVMVKRAPGFNPRAGDWEFLLVDGSASKVIERQKKGSCLDCHASQRERDFVYPLPAVK